MLTEKEKQLLESLLARENVVAKKLLEGFIWGNTTESTYKVNDIVLVQDLNYRIYGNPVNWFVGIVEKVERHSLDKSFTYKVVCYYKTTNKKTNEIVEDCIDIYVHYPIYIKKYEGKNISSSHMYVNKIEDKR